MRSSGVAWRIEYLRSAQKSVDKLNPDLRNRIRRYLNERVAALDDPRTVAKSLQGPLATYWRFRVGDYRIICDIQDHRLVILVITVGHRREVYR